MATLTGMHAQAQTLWRGPRWTLSLLLACLGMIGPFAIDAYLPAFGGIAAGLGATPVQMQQTLSAYLVGFAVMNLFHGSLADSLGRRPVVIGSIVVFLLGSVGCALSTSLSQLLVFRVLQGMSSGGGMVVSRAIIRDIYPPADAQRVMSQVTIFFGVAPAIAPMLGGVLFEASGWRSIFWMLAALAAVLAVAVVLKLPESLPWAQRQPFHPMNLLRGYWQMATSARLLALVLASGVPFNGMFIYVLSSPTWLGEHLRLAPTQFYWFFALNVAGIMSGAWCSGRLAGRMTPRRQIRWGYVVMTAASLGNVLLNWHLPAHASWAMLPVALYAFGWSLMVPVVTLLVLDEAPQRRGMASSVQSFAGAIANAFVAGVLAPAVMHSALALALASAALMLVGLVAWFWVMKRVS